jgi:hypothetical protein
VLQALFTQFAAGCSPTFFGLKTWHAYLKHNSDCSIKDFQVLGGTSGSDFVLILVAIIDDLLRIVALVAIGFIIYGGIKYVTSQGSPDQTGQAQNTILDALIGLVITMIAIAFVTFLGNKLG